ncbi:MAG TPA: hypothetical protein VI685_27260 [Candidatus Angelobacter sp.]
MKIMGIDNEFHPGITMHKIPVKAGFPGLLFTIGMMAVYLMGIPALIYFLVLAIVLGIGVAVMLRFIPRQAGFVILGVTAVMLMSLVGIPSMEGGRQELDRDLVSVPVAPPPPDFVAPFRCDCDQRKPKQPCDSTTRRDRERQKRPQPLSP